MSALYGFFVAAVKDTLVIGFPRAEQMVNNPSELVSRGGDCLGFAEFPSDAPKELTQIIFCMMQRVRGPLIATGLLWTAKKRLGLILLSLSMFDSLLFGLYHHFLAVAPDCIHSQPSGGWGTTFVLTAYLLLIAKAIGTYVGIHLLRIAKESSNKAVNA